MSIWRTSGRLCLALLIFPALILAVQVPLSIWFAVDFAPIFIPIGIIGGLFGGFLEESGLMGAAALIHLALHQSTPLVTLRHYVIR